MINHYYKHTYKYIYSFITALFLSFFFIPSTSHAAPSDCIQLSSDGQLPCTVAKSKFMYAVSNSPLVDTFEEITDIWLSAHCGSFPSYYTCYNQTSLTEPPLPPDGHPICIGTTCNQFTRINYNSFDNDTAWIVATQMRNDDPYYYNKYGQQPIPVLHLRICPQNTSAINLGPNTYLRLCKPQNEIQFKPTPCPDNNCKQNGNGSATIADPIDIASGTKTYTQLDYNYNSSQPFTFNRYYNHAYNHWSFDYNHSVSYSNIPDPTNTNNNNEFIIFHRANFQSIVFKKINNIWTEYNNSVNTSSPVVSQSGFSFVFNSNYDIILTLPNGDKETYINSVNKFNLDNNKPIINGFGQFNNFKLIKIEKANGQHYNLFYQHATDKTLLTKIVDSFNHEFNLNYYVSTSCNSVPLLSSITGPGNKTISYAYESGCNLTKTTYPDNTYKKYVYSSRALEKIIDENNSPSNNNAYQMSSYQYISGMGLKGLSEGLGTTGNIEKINLNYGTINQVKVTDALNNQVTLSTTKDTAGNYKITGYSSICPWCDGIQGSNITYYSNGLIDLVTDYKGNQTKYTWNNKNKLLSKTQAYGTTLARTTSYTYDSTNTFVQSITVPVEGGNRVTNYTYNSNNQIIQVDITAPKNDGSSTTLTKNYHFDYNNLGQLIEAKSPMYSSSFNDKISLTYNSNGQIATVTNGLGHVTTYNSYDDYGNPTQITMPNGSVQIMTYDLRGRLLSSTLKSSSTANDNETTSFVYDNAGQVIQMTKPSGSSIKMYYDTAHRLNKVEEYSEVNSYQGKTEYTLDNMSNVTSVKIFDSSNTQIRVANAQYDNKNRLYKLIGSLNQTQTYTYDNNSNLTLVNDAGNYNFSKGYDALNRVISYTNPDNGNIVLTYTNNNQIGTVTDPKGLVTTYSYDGFGNTINVNSPDTGTTSFTYDLNNNITSKKDAKNQTTIYSYDVLNRLIAVSYKDSNNQVVSSENITLTYDTCKTGQLCQIQDNTGTTTYTYNAKGRLISKALNYSLANGSLLQNIQYNYDSAGQLQSAVYPNGNMVNYTYSNNNIVSVSYTSSNFTDNMGINTTRNILSSAIYDPFTSEAKSFTWNTNNSPTSDYLHSKTFTQDGTISNISNSQTNSYAKNYGYDTRFNITNINGTMNTAQNAVSTSVTYDNKSRVTGFGHTIVTNGQSLTSSDGYAYNTSDDRISLNRSESGNYTFNYDSNSHRLNNITGSQNSTYNTNYTYDSNGNILTANNISLTYDVKNRLSSSQSTMGNTTYHYNALGQRIRKQTTQGSVQETTWFIYDESGRLISEQYIYSNNSPIITDYIYMNDKLVGVARDMGLGYELYHVQTDHIGSPRSITKQNDGSLVWSWDNKEAFGANLPNENPGVINSYNFKFNIRFMGQYWDEEKGTSYNYFRDYANGLGRYIQSDLIGLNAGVNTYGYVNSNPLNGTDFFGLAGYVCLNSVDSYIHTWFIIKNPIVGEQSIGWNPNSSTKDKFTHIYVPGHWIKEDVNFNYDKNKSFCMEIQSTPKFEHCISNLPTKGDTMLGFNQYSVINAGGKNCASALIQALDYCRKN